MSSFFIPFIRMILGIITPPSKNEYYDMINQNFEINARAENCEILSSRYSKNIDQSFSVHMFVDDELAELAGIMKRECAKLPIIKGTYILATDDRIIFIGGIQMLFLGIIGQYIAKIYLETKNRPVYILAETNLYSDKEKLNS